MTSANQAQGNRPVQRMGSLDLLRLVSALAVVAFHYLFRGSAGQVPYLDHPYPAAQAMALYGYLGLNLFFMISGFVIAWSAEGRTFRAFAIARFARLYPGFVICMTITFAVLLVAGDPRLPVGLQDRSPVRRRYGRGRRPVRRARLGHARWQRGFLRYAGGQSGRRRPGAGRRTGTRFRDGADVSWHRPDAAAGADFRRHHLRTGLTGPALETGGAFPPKEFFGILFHNGMFCLD